MEMRLIFLRTLIESLASIHDIIPGICGQCFEIRPRAYCPALFYYHTSLQTAVHVHFEIDTFTHNDHNGYVQISTNLTQKRLPYQCGTLIFINLRSPVVHSPYSPSYDPSNTPMHGIYTWKMVIYDRKIAAIILYIGSMLGNVYNKYPIIYCRPNYELKNSGLLGLASSR